MNVRYDYDWVKPHAEVACMLNEINSLGNGKYEFVSEEAKNDVQIGEGSSVVVIDSPGLFFFVGNDGFLYEWGSNGGGGSDSNLVGEAIVGTAKAG